MVIRLCLGCDSAKHFALWCHVEHIVIPRIKDCMVVICAHVHASGVLLSSLFSPASIVACPILHMCFVVVASIADVGSSFDLFPTDWWTSSCWLFGRYLWSSPYYARIDRNTSTRCRTSTSPVCSTCRLPFFCIHGSALSAT